MADYDNERNESSIPHPHIFVLGTKHYNIGISRGVLRVLKYPPKSFHWEYIADFNSSALAEHAWSASHSVAWENTRILSNCTDSSLIKEAILIRKTLHTLNRETGSLPSVYDNLIDARCHRTQAMTVFCLLMYLLRLLVYITYFLCIPHFAPVTIIYRCKPFNISSFFLYLSFFTDDRNV